MKRVGILFSDFGPYHVARIEALRVAMGQEGVELVAFRFTVRSDDYGWAPEDPKGVPVVTLAQSKPTSVPEAFKMAAAFGRELRERKVDAVFLPTYSPLSNFLCFLAAKLAGCRTILMTESWHGTEGASLPGKLIKHVLVRMFDSALVGGGPQRDYVVAYGMPREKVFTGYDVVDVAHFSARADKVRSMERGPGGVAAPPQAEEVLIRSLPERFFLNLGRFVEKKNLSTLVQAYARFARASVEKHGAWSMDHGDMQSADGKAEPASQPIGIPADTAKSRHTLPSLVLVGEGPLRWDLERQARDLGLIVRDGVVDPKPSGGAEVVFYPFQQADMTPLFFARCEAFVLPSSREEWGLVVNEAMACGAPVIVSNRVGAHFDLVQEGVNGFSFEPDDVAGLAQLFGRFDAEKNLRDRLGVAGRQRIEDWKPDRFGREGMRALEASWS
ncbi:MAG: glycosyltransferase family 4 protein [Verrucomicrobiota bacterium]